MNDGELFSGSVYDEEVHAAERELSAFMGAVANLFGLEQATLSAKDWLDESELTDSPPRSEARNWRSVTIAASARLASRVHGTRYRLAELSE